MPFARRFTTACVVLLTTAGTLAAQNTVQDSTVTDPQASAVTVPVADPARAATPAPEQPPVSLAPFAANATVGLHTKSSSDLPAPFVPPRADQHSQGVTLMIVGGAALLGGAIIGGSGGTVIMVGGVVCGAIGLYKFLQ